MQRYYRGWIAYRKLHGVAMEKRHGTLSKSYRDESKVRAWNAAGRDAVYRSMRHYKHEVRGARVGVFTGPKPLAIFGRLAPASSSRRAVTVYPSGFRTGWPLLCPNGSDSLSLRLCPPIPSLPPSVPLFICFFLSFRVHSIHPLHTPTRSLPFWRWTRQTA